MDNQKGDKEDSETSRATPQSPGRSPKGKRKVHDINVKYVNVRREGRKPRREKNGKLWG